VTREPDAAAFYEMLTTHRARGFRRVMRALPSEPRCSVCSAPYAGIGGRLVRPLGFAPSRKNPQLCSACFEKVPPGTVELEIGVLFADVRGYTALAERRSGTEVVDLLNRFYAAAVNVLCRHAIIDKLVGDQVMALYLPEIFAGDMASHMLADARDLLAAADPWLEIGIGLDFGPARVGNVGAGEVKDFTAIGDVVNTASRLQAVAAAGQIVASRRALPVVPADAQATSLELKGKSEPVAAVVVTPPT